MKEAKHQGYILFDFTSVKVYKRQNYADRRQIRGCQESGGGKRGLNTDGPEGTFEEMEDGNIPYCVCNNGTQLCIMVKTH